MPLVVLGTTQGILCQKEIFSWLNMIYHNVSDIVSQNMIIYQCFASSPGWLREPEAKCSDQKDNQRCKKQKDKGKHQPGLHALLDGLATWESAAWESLLPLRRSNPSSLWAEGHSFLNPPTSDCMSLGSRGGTTTNWQRGEMCSLCWQTAWVHTPVPLGNQESPQPSVH